MLGRKESPDFRGLFFVILKDAPAASFSDSVKRAGNSDGYQFISERNFSTMAEGKSEG